MSRLSAKVSVAYISATSATSALSDAISNAFARSTTSLTRSRRGATFIEYAILAAIAVMIGLIIQNFLAGSSGWIHKMLNILNNKTLTTAPPVS